VTFVNGNFADMGRLAPAHDFAEVDGILLDLGLSSRQLDDAQRGFSFQKDGPLDMRFDPRQETTAADLINNLDETELANLFWRYGEERFSHRYARAIVAQRPLSTTRQLADLLAAQVGPRRHRKRIHPATRVFQALRIATNQELEAIEDGLAAAIRLLGQGGRLAVISFHSLEDRIVKRLFRHLSKDCVCPVEQPVCTCDAAATVRLVTRKAIKATADEIGRNRRSRSARLRVAEKIAG
jgi:16S rRNA (cytosine1402-N4)-methyltransferase